MSRAVRIGATLLVLSVAGLLAVFASARVAEPDHLSIGPFDEELSCLTAGNEGVEDITWSADYECVGGPGAWYIDAVPVQPARWWDSTTSSGAAIILLGGSALTSVFWIALGLLLPPIRGSFSAAGNDPSPSGGDGGDSSDGGGSFWGGDSGGSGGGD